MREREREREEKSLKRDLERSGRDRNRKGWSRLRDED